MNTNYEILMKDLITHLFPPKVFRRHKRYLQRRLYKTWNTKNRYFICHIDEMVEYLEKFRPFGAGKRLLDDNVIELVEFSLPKEWQKQLIIQVFDSASQGLTELVKF